MSTDEATLILRGTVGLHLGESGAAHSSVVVVSHGGTNVVTNEHILLVVPGSEQVEVARICAIADCLQDHVVSLLDGYKADVFHGLNEGQCASVCLTGALDQVLTV